MNHSPARPNPDLQSTIAVSTPDLTTTEDSPTLAKIEKAVRRLRNEENQKKKHVALMK